MWGFSSKQVQFGRDPDDWKPMSSVGSGCREIRVRTAEGAFRTFYVTKFDECVYVLHVFHQEDADDVCARYRDGPAQVWRGRRDCS